MFWLVSRSIHAILDSKVHSELIKDAKRRGISLSKAIQRAIVIALSIPDVPVFTAEDFVNGNDCARERHFLPGEKMIFTDEDLEQDNEIVSRIYNSAAEAIKDLHNEAGLDA
jgi:hypothetical protein